jgi:hypothetical protein
MSDITISQIADICKIISAIIVCFGGLAGVFKVIMDRYMKPVNDRLDRMEQALSNQSIDIQNNKHDTEDIKNSLNNLTSGYNELKKATKSNRELDELVVKTLRVLVESSGNSEIKGELDAYLIHEAIV